MSKRLVAMSVKIFLAHPKAYLATVATGWREFFAPMLPGYVTLYRCSNLARETILRRYALFQKTFAPAVTFLFAIFSLAHLISYFRTARNTGRWDMPINVVAVAIVGVQSVSTALAVQLACERYAAPVQPLILLVVAYGCWKLAVCCSSLMKTVSRVG